jgi:hypothetical protein
MAKKTCSKGHVYDSSVYGDNCPFCPQGSGTVVNGGNTGGGTAGSRTEVNRETRHTQSTGPTIPAGDVPAGSRNSTVIRPVGDKTGTPAEKKIMGLLVTYDTRPSGQVFHIYEGTNSVGRDSDNSIVIPEDLAVSKKHLIIAYYPANGKFYFEAVGLTQNGTYLNDTFYAKGGDELHTYDVIHIGNTRLIFIAIPRIQQTDGTEHAS